MSIQGIKQRFGIIGRSPSLDRALSTAERVSSTDLTVLIQGESGVGKEVFSRIIHDLSKRKHNKFIAINCGAIPEGTINSELFGHEKGAFTGATGERKGYFETVSGGTIFLDEIGEMPLDTQAYLLRVLESGEYIRVGSSQVLSTDVRVIAATNIHLEEHIKKGKFREDLFYRLNTVPIYVPSLKERPEDIFMLFRKFAVDFAEKYKMSPLDLDQTARDLLSKYAWPGNIRELKNLVEQMSILSEKKEISDKDLLQFAPKLLERNLPALTGKDNGGAASFEEREILYKFLYEMKNDLNDLKSLVFELVRTNDLDMPDASVNSPLTLPAEIKYKSPEKSEMGSQFTYAPNYEAIPTGRKNRPVILDDDESDYYNKSEEVEESLSLEVMEKDFIQRALKKYRGRRKEAADELGISERTLYRKIKQYELED